MPDSVNLEVVRSALLAQNREDDEVFAGALHPEIVWEAGQNAFGMPEVLHGRDEVLRVAREARARAGRLIVTLHELRAAGDDVLVIGALSGTGLSMPRAWIFSVRDGCVVRVRAFGGRPSALSAWEQLHPSHDEA